MGYSVTLRALAPLLAAIQSACRPPPRSSSSATSSLTGDHAAHRELWICVGSGRRPCPTARPVAVSIVTTYGYDTPAAPPLSHDTKRSRVPSRDQSDGPAPQPTAVSLLSEGARPRPPTRRGQM